jgi:ketosteroid isomerase-like protein
LAACSGPSSSDVSEHAEGLEAKAVVETVYVAVAEGDMERFAGLMAPDIVWNEAEGNPYADKNPYVGPDAVMSGLFGRLASEWDDFSATPHELVVEGDRVIVFDRYKEVYKATGKALGIPFVHSWTVKDGKLIAFQQYTDTAALVAAMTPSRAGFFGAPMKPSDVEDFARRYADAWSSQSPESVATFFAETGSLTVNDDPPAVGRKAIEEVARGFMAAFPDMRVTFDSLSTGGERTLFHWTLTGTNTGPDGAGNAVKISGVETWLFGPDGLVAESRGSFDAEDYARQLAGE